ncbi:MAG: hypothetical protein WB735_12385, partial [Pseudonocardiaceae bacterium]
VELVASATDSLIALATAQRESDCQGGPERDPDRTAESWAWVNETLHHARGEDEQRSSVNE